MVIPVGVVGLYPHKPQVSLRPYLGAERLLRHHLRAGEKVALPFLWETGDRPHKGAGQIAEVDSSHRVRIPASHPPDLSLFNAAELRMADALLTGAVSLLFDVDSHRPEHPFVPIELCVVAEGPLRHFDAAREDVKVVVVLWLPERWKLPGSLSAPAEEVEAKAERGQRMGSTFRMQPMFNLAMLVLLPLPHRHDHTWRWFVRFRPLVIEIDKDKVGKLNFSSALTPSNGSIA